MENIKLYVGHRDEQNFCHVFVREFAGGNMTERALDPRFDLANHSPTGFEWGYAGSGPAQLALALLADALGDDLRALLLHQDFKQFIVSRLSRTEDWAMTDIGVRNRTEVIGHGVMLLGSYEGEKGMEGCLAHVKVGLHERLTIVWRYANVACDFRELLLWFERGVK